MTPTVWRLKGVMVRLTGPLFFRRVGAGTQFTGRIRWPMPRRHILIGKNCAVGHDVLFHTGRHSKIVIGDNTSLNSGCHVVANESITIGANVAIGEYVTIRDQDHKFTPQTGVRGQGFAAAPVVIEDNVWIGRGVHIGPGVTIGKGSIVAANAVVRHNVPPHTLVAGTPAVVKRSILSDGSTQKLA